MKESDLARQLLSSAEKDIALFVQKSSLSSLTVISQSRMI
jgi:hypothetical protein